MGLRKGERGEEKKMGHKGSLRKTVEQKESGIYIVTGNKEKMGDWTPNALPTQFYLNWMWIRSRQNKILSSKLYSLIP